MSDQAFDRFEQAVEAGGAGAGLDFLARKFREEKNYAQLFEARLMRKRHELGRPLLGVDAAGDWPEAAQKAYEHCFLEAAREAGGLYLADGDIRRAWPYFRAIGETAPVAAAIEKAEAQEGIEAVIEIAFHERVNPRRGFELILTQFGICRAITSFHQYPSREGRSESLRLLVRTLHAELAANLKRVIAQREGQAPQTTSVTGLIAARGWLFGEHDYYVDTSHVVSVLGFSAEIEDRETLALSVELADYGKRLSAMFQYRGDPPFDDMFADHAVYLRALLRENVDEAVEHFRRKIAEADPQRAGTAPAQVLVSLLARLGRYPEAIDVALEHLADADPAQLTCPSVMQLCQTAGDWERLRKIARERGDLLSFAAGAVESQSAPRVERDTAD